MAKADLQAKAFIDDEAAREAMESVLWPSGPNCAHCGSVEKIGKIEGLTARPGLYYCGNCKKQFTVTVGTIFERSKVPLSKWWLAIHLLASSKKGMSAHQLHRMLSVSYQTAWFMCHRIREAMGEKPDAAKGGLGGQNKVVEADETYVGGKARNRAYRVQHRKNLFSHLWNARVMSALSISRTYLAPRCALSSHPMSRKRRP